MKHYLGLDVGGTKTHCLIADETGRIRGFGLGGTGSYEYQGVQAAAAENRRAVHAALSEAGLGLDAISGIGMGVAGADLAEDYAMLERELYTPLFGDIPRVFRNDSMAGLRGGTRSPFGIVIVCGTGCVCAGKNSSGNETRVGGLGLEFGDKCTGATLGEEGLRSVWRARDGIIEATILTEKFVARAGCRDAEELFHKLYRRELDHSDLEPMAQLVSDAALDGDSVACDILREGGEYLGMMVNAVARKLGMTGVAHEVVAVGGVFKDRSGVLAAAVEQAVRPVSGLARMVRPAFEPVVGALLMGFELDVTVTDELYSVLTRELLAAEDRYSVQFKAG